METVQKGSSLRSFSVQSPKTAVFHPEKKFSSRKTLIAKPNKILYRRTRPTEYNRAAIESSSQQHKHQEIAASFTLRVFQHHQKPVPLMSRLPSTPSDETTAELFYR
jgi:hypothetical protein